jgi:hypothetical protein
MHLVVTVQAKPDEGNVRDGIDELGNVLAVLVVALTPIVRQICIIS